MRTEVEKQRRPLAGMELDLFHIVVEYALGNAAKEAKGVQMALDEGRQRHRGGKLDVELAGKAQDHHKAVDGKGCARSGGKLAHKSPVSLSLLTRRCLKTNGGFGLTLPICSNGLEIAAKNINRAGIALRTEFFEQTNGGKASRDFTLLKVGLKRVEAGAAWASEKAWGQLRARRDARCYERSRSVQQWRE